MIPVQDHLWHRVDPWPGLTLPPKHKLEVAKYPGGFVARVVGPHAHTFGEGPDFDSAIDVAVEWMEQCGGEL